MAEWNGVGCDSIAKYVSLKCGKFSCNRSLSCSIPAPEDYPGWKECKKVTLFSRCHREGNSSDYFEEKQSNNTNLQDSIEKEKEEVGTSDDNEVMIYCASRGFNKYGKIWFAKFGESLIV